MKNSTLILVGTFAALCFSACAALILTSHQKDAQISKLTTRLDSLHDENFILNIEKQRYEIAIDMLEEEDSLAWKKLDWILSHNVE